MQTYSVDTRPTVLLIDGAHALRRSTVLGVDGAHTLHRLNECKY